MTQNAPNAVGNMPEWRVLNLTCCCMKRRKISFARSVKMPFRRRWVWDYSHFMYKGIFFICKMTEQSKIQHFCVYNFDKLKFLITNRQILPLMILKVYIKAVSRYVRLLYRCSVLMYFCWSRRPPITFIIANTIFIIIAAKV